MFLTSISNKIRDRVRRAFESSDDSDLTDTSPIAEDFNNSEADNGRTSSKKSIISRIWRRSEQQNGSDEKTSLDFHPLETDGFEDKPETIIKNTNSIKPNKNKNENKKPSHDEKRNNLSEEQELDLPLPKDLLEMPENKDESLESTSLPFSQDEQKVENIQKHVDENKEDVDLLAGIFDQAAEEEECPLDILIASLPEVEINELIDETKEVKALIRQWHQNLISK